MRVVEIIFWLSLGLSVYIQIGYLFLLLILSFIKNKIKINSFYLLYKNANEYLPKVSIIIAAYNEEKIITKKLENTLKIEYPKEKLEIIVFSDASTDRTDEIVNQYAPQGIRLIRVEGRKGKTYCQDVAVQQATGDILIFTDADAMLEPDAVRQLVRHFVDPSVGCVAAQVRYVDEGGESWYQRYETVLFKLESAITSPTGVFGPLYALRRDLHEPIPPQMQEDLVRPLLVVYRRHRIVFEPEAIAWLHSTASVEGERRRRVRMVARAVYSLLYYAPMRALFNPFRYGFFALQMWSHRMLRWLHGVFLALMLASNLVLVGENMLYLALGVMQLTGYTAALVGYLIEKHGQRRACFPFHFAYYYLSAQIAMLQGFWKGLRGSPFTTWKPIR
jgi:cellulose synthase/poly-beta-1,6-N-acetylglucosamine synthase-like glycosyltransferase